MMYRLGVVGALVAGAALVVVSCGGDGGTAGDGANGANGANGAPSDGGAGARDGGGTASGDDAAGGTSANDDASHPQTDAALGIDAAPPTVASKARALTEKLGGAHADHFLVGMGNDGTNSGDDPAYHLGVTLDLHDHYLVGLSTEGGWTTWNASPDYAGKRIAEAKAHGVVPMLTYYGMAAHGDGNVAGSVQDASFMAVWWKDFAQALATIGAAGSPVVLHVEPDFGGYIEMAAIEAGGADKVSAVVRASGAAECASQPDTIVGWARCVLAMTRKRAPNAIVGFHASAWGTKFDVGLNTDPKLDVVGEAAKTAAFFKALGADQADFIATDLLDRDAGCYEAGPITDDKGNVVCAHRTGVYLDETNATLPSFHQELTWAAAVSKGLDLPILWWQIPFGVPSSTPGGTVGHFRDNRTRYVFAHVAEYVAAGGVGAVWGAGAGLQTTVASDGDQFKNAVNGYFAHPTALP